MGGLADAQAANNAPPSNSGGFQTLAQAQAAAAAANATSQKLANDLPVSDADYAQLTSYLNSGNYSGAWGYAAGFGNASTNLSAGANPLAGVNNIANQTGNSSPYSLNGAPQANPLINDLINGSDLNTLDPSLAAGWTPQSEAAFYSAATPYYNPNVLGTNPYGSWGDPSKLAADGTANANAGYAPNFEQFAGAVPGDSGLEKIGSPLIQGLDQYGLPIIAGVVASEIPGLGPIAAGAVSGLAGSATSDFVNNAPITLGSLGKGALTGAATAGVANAASGLTNNLSEGIGDYTGLSGATTDAIASGLVKGGAGAAIGAGGAALSGQNVGNGAITGGAAGAASGAIGSLSGSPVAGSVAGTIAGAGAGSLLGPSNPSMPSLGSSPGSSSLQALPANPNGGGTNIGSFSGYGYAPRQQVQNPVSNYNTYGQGPEANFFTPLTPASAPATSSNQPLPVPTALNQNIGTQQVNNLPASSSNIQNPTSFVGGNF